MLDRHVAQGAGKGCTCRQLCHQDGAQWLLPAGVLDGNELLTLDSLRLRHVADSLTDIQADESP